MLQFESVEQDSLVFSHLGFRPFFVAALVGAVVFGVLWAAIYSFQLPLLRADYPFISWHAHEMLFGYAFAVLTGFLLTAARNWTDKQTVNGKPLLLLLLLWSLGRILPFVPAVPFWYLALHEFVFMSLVLFFVLLPFSGKSQWKQLSVFLMLVPMIIASLLFYLGLMGVIGVGPQLGLYLGLYAFVALIIAMGRRVIPGFIENAIGGGFQVKNNLWLDWGSRGLFAVFLVTELTALSTGNSKIALFSSIVALILFVLHAYRLLSWHHRALWQHPLLWSLYLAYVWITLGFLIKFLMGVVNINPWAAVHAFAYGGIGLITAGMMARVTLGHTGRNVFSPPVNLGVWLAILVAGTFLRVVMVWIWPSEFQVWILAAQLMWIIGFLGLLLTFVPMLIKPSVESRAE